jgi:hypothetical protein
MLQANKLQTLDLRVRQEAYLRGGELIFYMTNTLRFQYKTFYDGN